jgi:WD40 repeat protein
MKTLESQKESVNSLACFSDGKFLAAGCRDGSILVWSMPDGKMAACLDGHSGNVTALAVSPDGKQLASASFDSTLRIWDPNKLSLMTVLNGHTKYVMTLDYSYGGDTLASGSLDGALILWSAESFEKTNLFMDQSMGVAGLVYTPDGRWLISSGVDGSLVLRNARTHGVQYTLFPEELGGTPQALAVSPDGRVLAVAMEMRIQLWMLEMATLIDRFDIQLRGLNGLAFSADGHWLANAASDHFIRVWDMRAPLN